MTELEPAGDGCPDEAQVERLLLQRQGSDEERGAFLAHLQRCAECRLLAGVVADEAGGDQRADVPPASHTPQTARAFADGEVLDDRYQILGFVARGGMGEVYRAHDRLLGETIALKTVLCESSAEEDALARFRAEVQLARRVTHRNVCRILEFGLHDRRPHIATPFFTMPFLDGETLGRHLARRGRLPAPEVRALVEQIAAGLEAIHREGIVHRDLKSENVFLLSDSDGPPRVILMDFGLAKPLLPSLPQMLSGGTGLVGTPAYVAPELLLGKVATPRADIYSLGVLVFEMLTGRYPFEGATAVQAAARRLYTDAPRLRDLVPSLDGPWDAFVGRCLERDEDRRFPNVGALSAAVPSAATIARGRTGRRRLAAFAAAVATVSTIGALVVVSRRSPPSAGAQARREPAVTRPAERAAPRTADSMAGSAVPSVAPGPPSIRPPDLAQKKKGRVTTRVHPSNATRGPEPEATVAPEHRSNLDALVNPYD